MRKENAKIIQVFNGEVRLKSFSFVVANEWLESKPVAREKIGWERRLEICRATK